MPIDNVTANRNWQLPNGGNNLDHDVARLIAALQAADVDVAAILATLVQKAPILNAALGGAPTATTPALADNSNKIATTAWARLYFADFIGAAPAALDTIAELATALQNNPAVITQLTTLVGTKLSQTSNLSDLNNLATARTNLSVYSKAENALRWAIDLIAAPAKATLVGADLFGISDSVGGLIKQVSWTTILAGVLAYFNASNKVTPVDADRIWLGDSTAANAPKYSTWTQVKAFLKTYFDTVYAAAAHSHTFASLTAKPSTIAGYGITDVRQSSAVVTASGAAVDLTGIPAGTSEVKLLIKGLSVNATGEILFQLGTGAGPVTSGYQGSHGGQNSGGGSYNLLTTGLRAASTSASDVLHGAITLNLQDAATNTWAFAASLALSNSVYMISANGTVVLPGTLDRVRATTIAGTSTFDAGTISAQWQ